MCLPWHHMSAHTALWVDGRAIRCVHRQLVDPSRVCSLPRGDAEPRMQEVQIINNTVHGEPAGAKAIARHGAPCPAVLYSLPVFDVWDWTDQVAVPADLVTLSNDRGNGDPSQGFLLGIQLEQLQQVRGSPSLGPPVSCGLFL